MCAALFIGTTAHAKDLENAPTESTDIKSINLAAIAIPDIKLPDGAKPLLERKMHLRRLDVSPGGVIPLHEHQDQPTILYVVSGCMYVHDNLNSESQMVEAGDAAIEYNNIRHWAKNCSDSLPLTLLTFDLLDDSDDPVPTTKIE